MRLKIRVAFFDIGGVLVDLHPEKVFQFWGLAAGIPPETVEKTFPQAAHYRYEKGLLSDGDFARAVRTALPQPNSLDEADFWRGWDLLVGSENGTTADLEQVARQVPVWLLSNTNRRHLEQGLSRGYTFFRSVTGAVYSYQVGSRKPEPEIFRQALRLTGTRAEESLLVDDNRANFRQARRMGFQVIHFRNRADLKRDLVQLGFRFE